jgi:hypothetical protein
LALLISSAASTNKPDYGKQYQQTASCGLNKCPGNCSSGDHAFAKKIIRREAVGDEVNQRRFAPIEMRLVK